MRIENEDKIWGLVEETIQRLLRKERTDLHHTSKRRFTTQLRPLGTK